MKKKIFLLGLLIFMFGLFENVYAIDFSNMPSGSYIIGENLYTRSPFWEYNGILKTEYIMKASKTINNDDVDSMIIYYKNPRGIIINALTGEELDVDGQELMENVRYYNGKEIPIYTLEIAQKVNDNTTDYTFWLSEFYESSDHNNVLSNLYVKYDLYGAKYWDGVIYPVGSMPNYGENDNILKLVSENVDYSFATTLNNGTYYSYVAYPFIENGDDKIYLEHLDPVTLYGGAEVNASIVDNKLQVSVSGIDKYAITSAVLYSSENTKSKLNHIEPYDLFNYFKINEKAFESEEDSLTEKSIDSKFLQFSNLIAGRKSSAWGNTENTYYWYLADLYAPMSDGYSAKTIELGDLGNSEKEEHEYKLYLTIASPSIVSNGQPITIVYDRISGVVNQWKWDDNIEEIDELHLFEYIMFINSLASEFEDIDIDFGDINING